MPDDVASAGAQQYNALSGALADRYRIERVLGEGGMATVYLAHDLKHDRKVALKVLKPELGAVLGAERFLSEIKVTAQLQHPNLLPLFDSGEAGDPRDSAGGRFLYYVMPFVEGETLRARLEREKQLSIAAAVGIVTGISYALAYAHDRGVIHRTSPRHSPRRSRSCPPTDSTRHAPSARRWRIPRTARSGRRGGEGECVGVEYHRRSSIVCRA